MRCAKDEIDVVLKILMKSNNARDLRTAMQKLVQLFRNTSFRKRLTDESGGGVSSIAVKRQAISILWKNVFDFSMLALKNLRTKKCEAQEYKTFSELLQNHGYEGANTSNIRPCLPLTTINKIREFVFELFDNEVILDVAEKELFMIASSMCSNKQFIGAFRPTDFDALMDLFESRLDIGKAQDCNISSMIVLEAAKTLQQLIRTTKAIGISMHDHFSECFAWISQRCRSYLAGDKDTSQTVTTSLLATATILMKSEPEHAIGPIRVGGNIMLAFARRLYALKDQNGKNIAVEYILAHL